ncbi:MAG: DUF3105 domain-containing protein [Nocardioidaceae bacterium]|nr:DUF3105 domain-containing protein [Nocardioidaceae bacterium]NUS49591.1 DUF3105 domain-containing protein [Nocardioidaceae bacterium]
MAKSKKDKDRRAVIEQMRREQQSRERRRTYIVVAVCVVVAAAIIGAAAIPLIQQNQKAAGALADIGVSKSAAGCRDVVKKQATGNQDHKPQGTPITYDDAPPAFGPHWPTPAEFSRKFYTTDDRPDVETLVHNLEHGYTILWYDDTLSKDKVSDVKAIASKFEDSRKLTDKFIAAPWTSEDGKKFPDDTHVALTHWSAGGDPSDPTKQQGVWQYCAAPSGEAVAQFMKDWPYTDSPEPQGA